MMKQMMIPTMIVNRLPSKELSTIITLTFPIGFPMPGSPIILFLPLVFVGDDKHDAHYNDYYSHIIAFTCLLYFQLH